MTEDEYGQLAAKVGRILASGLASPMVTIPGDGALAIDRDATFVLTKGSAAAITLADPGAANLGRRIVIIAGSDFAHVVTTTAAIANGTAAKNTWTSAAFIGSSITLRAVSATLWAVVNHELGTFA